VLGQAHRVGPFYGCGMRKRVLVIVAGVVVVAFLVYVGVSSVNGSYGTAAGIGEADVTATNEGNTVVAKIRTVTGVQSASFVFSSGLLGDRKSELSVELKSSATLFTVSTVLTIAREQYANSAGLAAGAELTFVMPGAPQLDVTDFSMSSTQLHSDVAAWDALRTSTGTSISLQLAPGGRRTLAFVSHRGAAISWISSHYALLKSLSEEGFTWSSPGVCSVSSLPDEDIIEVIARVSAVVPIAPCNSAESQSGLEFAGGSGKTIPTMLLGFVKGGKLQTFASHATQFAEVAMIALDPKTPSLNVAFFGFAGGKLTTLRFFTGPCASAVVPNADGTDPTSLSILKARGIDVVTRATLGSCAPPHPVPSASPTPAG
jgi:hypothetical protein